MDNFARVLFGAEFQDHIKRCLESLPLVTNDIATRDFEYGFAVGMASLGAALTFTEKPEFDAPQFLSNIEQIDKLVQSAISSLLLQEGK